MHLQKAGVQFAKVYILVFVGKMHPESQTGSGNRHCDRTVMANSDVVPTVDGNFDKEHPLWKKLKLIVCKVSGKVLENKVFQNSLPTYVFLEKRNKETVPVSKDTISRWIRVIMTRAGIDVQEFGAHSASIMLKRFLAWLFSEKTRAVFSPEK
ncbi:hypothetical protein DPMN_010098 [Dreissena polymorpha]|uniref:Uncharacterized protein n=1 Tax=Dreissena polymorpha TaxID=45954 RepID=A0A9D4S178_DREPO|nr:hypothetical protein DPMN_010098 [Dreissena polymorpha]